MTPKIIVIIGMAMFASGAFGVLLAHLKNRNPDSWGFSCFIFPPLVFLLLILPKSRKPRRRKISEQDFDQDTRDDLFLD